MNDHTEEPRVRIHTGTEGHAVVRLDDGLTVADIEAALADAGAWVEVAGWDVVPDGARLRNEWVRGRAGDRTYVHRDDLPPTDPDAELVEKMARAEADSDSMPPWHCDNDPNRPAYLRRARAALAVVREHEAKS